MKMNNLVRILKYYSRGQVNREIIDLLKKNNINVYVVDRLNDKRGYWKSTGSIDYKVQKKDVERVFEILSKAGFLDEKHLKSGSDYLLNGKITKVFAGIPLLEKINLQILSLLLLSILIIFGTYFYKNNEDTEITRLLENMRWDVVELTVDFDNIELSKNDSNSEKNFIKNFSIAQNKIIFNDGKLLIDLRNYLGKELSGSYEVEKGKLKIYDITGEYKFFNENYKILFSGSFLVLKSDRVQLKCKR